MKLIRVPALVALCGAILASCSTPKQATIEGYSSADLNRTRIVLLLPSAGEITFGNADQFGTSRGVAGASSGETFESELRTVLVDAMQARLDSNTILNYAEMPAAGIVPMSATADFTAAGPTAWDKIKRAGQEGAIDYLLVLRDVRVQNTAGSDPRGSETVTAGYLLLDVRKQTVMTTGTVSVDIAAPRTVAATHERMAAVLTEKLPFTVVE